jgi:hypothetical protein
MEDFAVRLLFAAAPIALLAFAGSATATTLVLSCTGVPQQNTELNASLACPQFNGTGLTSIQLDLAGQILGTIVLTNNGAESRNGTGTTSSEFDLGLLSGFVFPTPFFIVSFTTGSQTLAGGETKTFAGLSGTNGASSVNSNAATFSTYQGAGDFTVPVTTTTSLIISGGGGQFGGSQTTQASAAGTVTYTFSEGDTGDVPEPGSLLLLGAGLMGISLTRRRAAR